MKKIKRPDLQRLVWTLAILSAVAIDAAAQVADPPSVLERQVSRVYLEEGWLLDQLPELFAQLEISGGIDFGYWTAKPDRKDPKAAQPPPASTRIPAFEFETGTVREALDAFVDANPSLSWRVSEEGVLVQREPRSQAIQQILATPVGKLGVASIPEKDHRVGNTLGRAWDAAIANAPEAVATFMQKEGRVELPKYAFKFPGRTPLAFEPWAENEDQTFKDVLTQLTSASPPAFWMAIEGETKRIYGENLGDPVMLAITTASPVRRRLDTAELVSCLRADDEQLRGYRSVKVRIDDAQRELERRYHFQPQQIADALTRQDTLQMLLPRADWSAWYRTQWLTQLGDPNINRAVFDSTRRLRLMKNHVHPLGAFPHPPDPKFDPALLPQWQDVAENAPDQEVRDLAQHLLDLHRWYEDGGKDSGRPRPSVIF